MSAGSQVCSDHTVSPLDERLRKTLIAARANLQIRESLRELVADPARFDPLVRELGPRHTLIRELIAITQHGTTPAAERAA